MPVSYFGSGLVPAPLVLFKRSNVRDANGNILHPDYTFTLEGTIVNIDTSLDSPGASTASKMEGIIAGQNYIRSLFQSDGGLLSVTPPVFGSSSNTINAYCRVEDVVFNLGQWVRDCKYNVVLKATSITGWNDVNSTIDSEEETFSINENIDGTFGISHRVSAIGALTYDSGGNLVNPTNLARAYCSGHMSLINNNGNLTAASGGLGFVFAPGNILSNINDPTNVNFWNYSLVESPGVGNRSWSISESFLYAPSGNVLDKWNAGIIYRENDQRYATISVNGTIVGFADRASNLSSRNTRASGYFYNSVAPSVYTRLLNYTPPGYVLNPVPLGRIVTLNLTEGVINYTYNFTAVSGQLFAGSVEESIDIVDTGETDIFAIIGIPGRSLGSLIQSMNTYTNPERNVNISITYPPVTSAVTSGVINALYLAKPDTSQIIVSLSPNTGKYYMKTNVEQWQPIQRRYQRNVSWIMPSSGVLGIPSVIDNP